MVNVLVVNKSRLICSVTAAALREKSDIQIEGAATSVEEALDLLRRRDCDVILVSTNLPNDGALELAKMVDNSAKVLVIGVAETKEVILRYAEAGVAGYVLREDSIADLLKNIRAAHRGQALISADVASALMARIAQLSELTPNLGAGAEEHSELTPREQEVLNLIGGGLSNREIADRLVIEVGTVKNHVHSILRKLDVDSRHEAASYWDAIQES